MSVPSATVSDVSVDAVPAEPTKKTAEIGSHSGNYFEMSWNRPVDWVQVCWNYDVIKGFAFRFHGEPQGALHTVGDWNNTSRGFQRSVLEIAEDDVLDSFSASTSEFGYVSVKHWCLQTRVMKQEGREWCPGQRWSPISQLDVKGRKLMGFFGHCNPDQFINGIGLFVTERVI